MRSRQIPDDAITASSENNNKEAKLARLSDESGYWQAKQKDIDQWLQVDLGTVTIVTKLATQGSISKNEWVERFALSYSIRKNVFELYEDGKVILHQEPGVSCI